jgi:cell division protein FtsX
MSSSNQQEWQRKIKDLKIKVDSAADEPIIPEILSSIDAELLEGTNLQEKLQNTQNWFEQIPASAKVAVVVGVAIIGLMLLKTVFQLVTSMITLAIVGAALWLVYRFVITPKQTE